MNTPKRTTNFERILKELKSNVKYRRFGVLALIILIIYLMRRMATVFLLTFIFTFVVIKTANWFQRRLKCPRILTVILIYGLIVAGLISSIAVYLPKLAERIFTVGQSLISFYRNPHRVIGHGPDFFHYRLTKLLIRWFYHSNGISFFKTFLRSAVSCVANAGSIGISAFLALVLSFFFTIEFKKMKRFSKQFLTSGHLRWFFCDVYYFARIFCRTFGVVIEAQLLIAICNTLITTAVMAILKMPQLLVLSILVFFLSLIPIAGVIISFVPLSLIGYSAGGIKMVLYLAVMILAVHALEAYVLNPKFMSHQTKLPIFYTFVVLLVGEEIFGNWGLIISVPVFTFFLDVLKIQRI